MTEIRYRVVEYIQGYVVARIEGNRSAKQVKTLRTKATEYTSVVPVEKWDKLPKSPEEARQAHIDYQTMLVESARARLQRLEEDLAKAKAEVDSYEVKDIR